MWYQSMYYKLSQSGKKKIRRRSDGTTDKTLAQWKLSDNMQFEKNKNAATLTSLIQIWKKLIKVLYTPGTSFQEVQL